MEKHTSNRIKNACKVSSAISDIFEVLDEHPEDVSKCTESVLEDFAKTAWNDKHEGQS